MPQCIFCDEGEPIELPEDCKECPQCFNPPFSGMMFDPKRKEEAERLEDEGDLDGAWEILSEEWMNHTDMDYFDDDMATQIRGWIDELFERNPNMTEQRVEMKLMIMRANHYWGGHNEALDRFEEALRIAREADRPDLELEALEMHGSIQSQRYGGIQNMPQYDDFSRYKTEVLQRIEEANETSE
jgi:hypothetical protein